MRIGLQVGLAFLITVELANAQTAYRDPQNRFSLTVPAGWTVTNQPSTLVIAKGNAYNNVTMANATGTAREIVTSLARQVSGQWTNLQPVGAPDLTFAGQPGAATLFIGNNPRGTQAFMAVYASVAGNQAITLIQSAPMAEYQSLEREMDSIAGSLTAGATALTRTPAPATAAAPPTPIGSVPAQPPATAPGTNYEAQDHSISYRIPQGWRAGAPVNQGMTLHVMDREGGPEKIFVGTGTATASLPELTQQSIQAVTQQLLPGLRVAGQPRTLQLDGATVVEISYRGVAGAGGEVAWWQLVGVQNNRFVSVLGGGQAAQSTMIQNLCQTVYRSARLGKTTENVQLTSALIGHWTFYERGGVTGGSSSKEITFAPNGRFAYKAATYVPISLPIDVNPVTEAQGSYRVEGNTIYYQPDGGAPSTFIIQLLQNGQALSLGGQVFTRG